MENIKKKPKQVTLKMSQNELELDKIAHQLIFEQVLQSERQSGSPEHIAHDEALRKAYGHAKRIDDIDKALASMKKKAPEPEPEEEEEE